MSILLLPAYADTMTMYQPQATPAGSVYFHSPPLLLPLLSQGTD